SVGLHYSRQHLREILKGSRRMKTQGTDFAEEALNNFLDAVQSRRPVDGLTHNFYRYPARFSPLFARAAIELFSKPGDIIMDPFAGGCTTLVECLALGRHGIGLDISRLGVFLGQVKTMLIDEDEADAILDWAIDIVPDLSP